MKRIINIRTFGVLYSLCFLLLTSCNNTVSTEERSGYTVEGGGLCYSVEWDGDKNWYYFMPTPSSLPYGELFKKNSYGKFYQHWEYSSATIPKLVKSKCMIVITNDDDGWVKWEEKK